MSWIEIIRLIVAIWPLIEKILAGIEDDQKKKKIEEVAAKWVGELLQNSAVV